MPLDFTEHYRLRKPKATDAIDGTDFNRFFGGNQDRIDAELYRLSDAVSKLNDNAASLESGETPASASDLNALRSTLAGYGDRIAALERGGTGGSGSPDTSGSASLNDAISAMQTTLLNHEARITNLEQNGTNAGSESVNLTPLENRITELESALGTLSGVSGRLSNLESALGTLSGRVNVLESAVNSGGGTGTGSGASGTISADASAQIQALRSNVQADLTLLTNRLILLESSAFTDFREGDDGYWYAYNKSGVQVDGPFRLGYLNGGKTWADIFGVVEIPEPTPEPETAPRTWAQVFGLTA